MARAVLYFRVSTDTQTTSNQELPMRRHAAEQEWEVTELSDIASGTKATRPGYQRMLEMVRAGEVDVVFAWSVDRLGRSLKDFLALVEELNERKVRLVIHNGAGGGLDSSTPTGMLILNLLSAVAEWEAAWLRQRVAAGISRARAEGKRLGAEPLSAAQEAEILALRAKGFSHNRIAITTGRGGSSISRVLRKHDPLGRTGSRSKVKPKE